MQPGTHRNRLADEASPYLRQHANNPVDWHPWGEAALRLAREQGKPILLSIGYSACHWCHVMAHESFENDALAELMNRHFINIKVDREERPDLDKIYQLAHQILTRHGGGWPLTMFLTHDTQQPFFGGTYFPPVPRHGLPGFADLLTRVSEYYHEHAADIRQQSASLQRVFQDLSDMPPMQDTLDGTSLQRARQTFEQQFDGEYGGFGGAPKFPHPRSVEWLLRHWHQSSGAEQPDLHALYMNALTLTRMAEGGIYDQLGGGFFRYSVDAHWSIPHFEKMLYDNAELLRVYAQTALATGDPVFRKVVQDTAQWMIGTLQSPQGAFWSTLDADSEGHEGQYYVWSREEIRALLQDDEFDVVAQRFGLDGTPNFEGRFHLRVMRGIDDIAQAARLETTAVEQLLAQARQRLLAQRVTRVAPGLDDKKLVSWNGLAISGLAQAARLLGNETWSDAACAAVDEIRSTAWRDGRLYAVITAQGESARFNAYLDDYAFLLDGLLELLQTRWRDADLDFAMALADVLLDRFTDAERGGFFFTADDHETLIHRSKSFADEAVPSGNGVAALALARLGWLTGETRYLDAAAGTLRAGWAVLQQQPTAHASLMMALEEQLKPITLIVIRGAEDEANEWRRSVQQLYSPRRMVVAISPQARLPETLAAKIAQPDTVAYVCQGTTCSAPVKSLNALLPLAR